MLKVVSNTVIISVCSAPVYQNFLLRHWSLQASIIFLALYTCINSLTTINPKDEYHIYSYFPYIFIYICTILSRPAVLQLHQFTQSSLTLYSPFFPWNLSPFGLPLTIWITLSHFQFSLFWQLDLNFVPLLLIYSISPLLFWPTSIAQHFLPAVAKSKSAAVLIWHLWLIFGTILHISNDSNVQCYCNIIQDFRRMEPINSL